MAIWVLVVQRIIQFCLSIFSKCTNYCITDPPRYMLCIHLLLSPFSPTWLSVCKFSLHYLHKISCLVMRTKFLVTYSCNLSKMKNKILPACLQGNYRDSLGEFTVVYVIHTGTWHVGLRGLTSCPLNIWPSHIISCLEVKFRIYMEVACYSATRKTMARFNLCRKFLQSLYWQIEELWALASNKMA